MKIIANYIRRVVNEQGEMEITFSLRDYHFKRQAQSLENIPYSIEIKEVKGKRTLQQNAYIWALIHEIDLAINGHKSDEMSIYCNLIEMSNIQVVPLETIEAAKPELEKTFRVVKEIERRKSIKGADTVVYKCYFGTSHFNKEEMSRFIENLLDYAQEVGVETAYYDKVLR